jgi:hypothetical protein
MKLLENIEKLIILSLLFSIVLVAAHYRIKVENYEKEINGLNVRLAQAEEKADTFLIHDSIPVIQQKVVEVDKTDYKKVLADKQLIKELNLKVKEIEAENRFLLSTRDTVVLKPALDDSTLTYSDHWNRFSFELKSRVLDWEVRDSLVTFVSAEYKHHFLWWRWGLKGYQVTHVNFNPKSRIEYNKYIKIK